MKINEIIKKPVITEKASNLVKNRIYTFEVHQQANKNQVAQVIEALYKVKVEEVRMVNRIGKVKQVGRMRTKKQMPDRKLAYVVLKEGKIDLFPQT